MKKIGSLGDFDKVKNDISSIGMSIKKMKKCEQNNPFENAKVESIELLSTEINLPENGGIFDPNNDKYGQFGGNQGSLIKNKEEFLNSQTVMRIVDKYFPNEPDNIQWGSDDLELLFYRMNSVGCSYVAGINTIFNEYLNYDEIDFQKRFGFPPYKLETDPETGILHKVFNYEYLFLDFFLYYAVNQRGFTTFDEVLGNAAEERENRQAGDAALDDIFFQRTGMNGTSTDTVGEVMQRYLAEKGIELTTTRLIVEEGTEEWNRIKEELRDIPMPDPAYLPASDLSVDDIKEVLNEKGQQVIISMQDFSLYCPYDKDGNGILDDIYCSDVGAHAMQVVGITDDDKLIVSSWGHEYLVDIATDSIIDYTIYEYGNFN